MTTTSSGSRSPDQQRTGGDLFIVDNSISGWTGLRYLDEWTDLADTFDVATGYFEIGSLIALDGKWQKLKKIRILMGDETTHGTKKALLAALKARTETLDAGLEADKERDPFLAGVPAIIEAMKTGQIECKIYNKDKFHAKAYITHSKSEVIGALALVGSSNFTKPGLTQNVELNVQIQSRQEVAQLQHWFEKHWNEAEDVTDEIIKLIHEHVRDYSPFEVYAKALHEYFKGYELTDSEWEENRSLMFPVLDHYQKEAYWSLMKIGRQHNGAFLCDGVGLGKTFVGLMLIERLVLREGKRVVLFAPKAAKEGVWEPHLARYLSHIGGVGGGADFSNLAVFSHTDLNRQGDFPARFQRITELADAVIIDEAHHFRNPGRRGNTDDPELDERSRYHKLYDLLSPEVRAKTLYMLTATPINNRLSDIRHMIELFSRNDEAYFAKTIGINNLSGHFNGLEKELRRLLDNDTGDLTDRLIELGDILHVDEVFRHLVVQRSRAYAKESQLRETGTSATFPERKPPQVAEYSIFKTYGGLLKMVEDAFAKDAPLFSLPIYYPLAYYKGSDADIDPLEEGRQKQVVGLIRTQFLKRFESSICAFELSCDRLLRKLLAFLEVHSTSESQRKVLDRWKLQNAEIINYNPYVQYQLALEGEPEEADEDVVSPELLAAVAKLDPDEYRVDEIMAETYLDLNELVRFLTETRKFDPKHDDKLKKLIRLLKTKDFDGNKVLIFSEFADTARYIASHLAEAGVAGVAEIDSGSKMSRADVIRRFSPYYNGIDSPGLEAMGQEEIRILVSTDVLSEGLNLQDASRLINYDIHWNPVRLMQRIGRVDRRMNPEHEAALLADHPEMAEGRGVVQYWNFLPPDELNKILSLYSNVSRKTLVISKTLGIEGRKLLRPDDNYDELREFNEAYEGTKTAVEGMHLEYQDLIRENESLAAQLDALPRAIFSGKDVPKATSSGVFFCFRLPALDRELDRFTIDAGTTMWYLYDLDQQTVLDDPAQIVDAVRSVPATPRTCRLESELLVDIRAKVLKHVKNTYLKRLDVPLDAPKPRLSCWMELDRGL